MHATLMAGSVALTSATVAGVEQIVDVSSNYFVIVAALALTLPPIVATLGDLFNAEKKMKTLEIERLLREVEALEGRYSPNQKRAIQRLHCQQ